MSVLLRFVCLACVYLIMICVHIDSEICERQSRSRERRWNRPHTPLHLEQLKQIKHDYLQHQHHDTVTIDRETVIKINRLATRRNLYKRDNSWPPPHAININSENRAKPPTAIEIRSSSSDNVVHFNPSVCRQHNIDSLCEKFNRATRIIEPTARDVREERKRVKHQKPSVVNNGKNRARMVIANDAKSTKIDTNDNNKEVNLMEIVKVSDDSAANQATLYAEGIGFVEPNRNYYERLDKNNKLTSELEEAHPLEIVEHESHSLDRMNVDLHKKFPPLKPRSASTGGYGSKTSPKLQRRRIKLATEMTICYDGEREGQLQNLHDATSTQSIQAARATAAIKNNNNKRCDDYAADLEAIPLPELPKTRTLATTKLAGENMTSYVDVQQQQQQQQKEHLVPIEVIEAVVPDFENYNFSSNAISERPTTINVSETQKINSKKDQLSQQIDDTCIYLRSIDLLENTVAYIPAAITIVPSPTDDIIKYCNQPKQLRQTVTETLRETETDDQRSTFVSRLPASINQGIKLKVQHRCPSMETNSKDTISQHLQLTQINAGQVESGVRENQKAQFYTDGEYVYGAYVLPQKLTTTPMPNQINDGIQENVHIKKKQQQEEHKQQSQTEGFDEIEPGNRVDIKNVAEKYEQIQQSIAVHLRQIDAYMNNAKLALNQTLQQHQQQQQQQQQQHEARVGIEEIRAKEYDKNLAMEIELWPKNAHKIHVLVETPLQLILKQFDHKNTEMPDNKSIVPSVPCNDGIKTLSTTTAIENMPVIEKALTELASIANTMQEFDARTALNLQQPLPKMVMPTSSTFTNSKQVEGEVLELAHRQLPQADAPEHVYLDEEQEDYDKGLKSSEKVRPTDEITLMLASRQKLIQQANLIDSTTVRGESKGNLDNIADVVANYEQLLADIRSGHHKPKTCMATTQTLPQSQPTNMVAHGESISTWGVCSEQSASIGNDSERDAIKDQLTIISGTSNASQPDDGKTVVNIFDEGRSEATLHLDDNHEHQSSCSDKAPQEPVSEKANEINNFDTYQATYEIRSPYRLARQISWGDEEIEVMLTNKSSSSSNNNNNYSLTNTAQQKYQQNALNDEDVVFTKEHHVGVNTPVIATAVTTSIRNTQMKRDVVMDNDYHDDDDDDDDDVVCGDSEPQTPLYSPIRKYPAALPEPHVGARAASPFGLNLVDENYKTPCLFNKTRSATPEPLCLTRSTPTPPSRVESPMDGQNVVPPPPPPLPPRAASLMHTAGKIATKRFPKKIDNNVASIVHELENSVPKPPSLSPDIKIAAATTTATTTTTTTPMSCSLSTSSSSLKKFSDLVVTSSSSSSSSKPIVRACNHKMAISPPRTPTTPSFTAYATAVQVCERIVPTLKATTTTTPTIATTTKTMTLKLPAASSSSSSQLVAQQENDKHASVPANILERSGEAGDVQMHDYSSTSLESNIMHRSFDNVSPRPYITIEGYKRVAWPPASEERIIHEFTPQPQATSSPMQGAEPQVAIYNNVRSHNLTQQQRQSPQPQQHYNHLNEQPQQQYNQINNAPKTSSTRCIIDPYQHNPNPTTQYSQGQYNRINETPVRITEESFLPATPPLSHLEQQQQYYYEKQQQLKQQQQQQQRAVSCDYQRQQQQQQQMASGGNGDGQQVGGGWKPIRRPLAKHQKQYEAQTSLAWASTDSMLQPQYRASSYDNYQGQQERELAPNRAEVGQSVSSAYDQQQSHQMPYQSAVPVAQGAWKQPQEPINYNQPQQQQQQQPPFQQHNQPRATSVSQDQLDHQAHNKAQSVPQDYRGGSPGIIALRKEAPISQLPAAVYSAQPAAIGLQGGSNMRGDLKWPPSEYKVAAERENEERRKLALGPVCRPRKVQRDFSSFFAKNALNSYYPSYKVPPGTQHMLS